MDTSTHTATSQSDTNSAARRGRFPMPVAEFLRGDYLQRADVVLCRGKSGLASRAIQWATGSPFTHAALVFLVPSREDGFDGVFLIESVTSGVDITDLRHYVRDQRKHYDVAIKRFEAPWFDESAQRLVRGTMLNHIKADYDYRTIGSIGRAVLRRLLFRISVWRHGLHKSLAKRYARMRRAPAEFICSGFVQYGFLEGVKTYCKRAGLRFDDYAPQVVFKPDRCDWDTAADVMSTTPQDLAASERLAWKYVIRAGIVYKVGGAQEVERVLGR